MVFVSGWATNARMWSPVMNAIRPNGRVDCVEWWDCVEDDGERSLLGRLNHLAGAVVCVGWSLGGLIALEAAAKKPEKVRALVLVSATARMGADREYAGVSRRRLRAMRLKLRSAVADVLRDFFKLCVDPCRDGEVIEALCRQADDIAVGRLAAGLRCLSQMDLREALGDIRVPCLVLHGQEDAVAPVEQGEHLAKHVRGARFVRIPGVGHAVPQLAAGALAEEIERFLDDVGS